MRCTLLRDPLQSSGRVLWGDAKVAKGGLHWWHLLVIVLLAAMIGTAIGDILVKAMPGSRAVEMIGSGVRLGTTSPIDLDMRVAQVTLGAGLRLTVLGGLLAAGALLLLVRRVH